MSTVVEVSAPPELEHLGVPLADLARAVLDAEDCTGTVVLALVDEDSISALNQRYRGIAQPTDVLAFRYADGSTPWPEPGELGEVAVCETVVRRYAEEAGGEPGRALGWTVIHGLLHLVGYDHEADSGEMRRREQVLLKELAPLVEAVAGCS